MVFSSPEFLFAFLPATLILYFLLRLVRMPVAGLNVALLLVSLLFYFWGGGALIVLLLGVIAFNFVMGWTTGAMPSGWPRKASLAIAVIGDLAFLSYFKYANFFVDQINAVSARTGENTILWTDVALPIGISFFTFHALTYVIDVYRGEVKVTRNPFDFALYICFFPQLIAGPIVRYKLVESALKVRRERLEDFAAGSARFLHGLFKKVLIADSAGAIADLAFASPQALPADAAWIGLIAYTLQIYFDFSGYSDMAIGLARMFAIKFPENFARPYSAVSITDFWRRWHMTLSAFFRDFLYKPLGGSHGPAYRTYFNLVLVFLLTGLWHGANWTFIIWGAYHGLLLLIERALNLRRLNVRLSPWTGALSRLVTLFLVMLGWAVFRADNLDAAGSYLGALFGGNGDTEWPYELAHALNIQTIAVLLAASAVVLLPRDWVGGRVVEAWVAEQGVPALQRIAAATYLAFAAAAAMLLVTAQTYTPFLYFQF